MKTLFTLLLSLLSLHADPIACKYGVKDGFLTVTWCNLTPGSDWFVEWTNDVGAWLGAGVGTGDDPKFPFGLTLKAPITLDETGTVTLELEMTEPRQFVRLVEYPPQ